MTERITGHEALSTETIYGTKKQKCELGTAKVQGTKVNIAKGLVILEVSWNGMLHKARIINIKEYSSQLLSR